MDLFSVQQQLRAGGKIPQELVEVFREEAEEHIHVIYDGLDRLCVELNDSPALADIRRASHTLKGAAGAVGHFAISSLSRRIEDLLDFLSENKQPLNTSQLELLLEAGDHLQGLLLGEFEFDATANSLLDIHLRFEQQFAFAESEDVVEEELEDCLLEEQTADETDCEESFESQLAFPTDESESILEAFLRIEREGEIDSSSDNEEFLSEAIYEESSEDEPEVAPSIDSTYLELALEQLNASIDVSPEIQAIFSEEAQDLLRAIYRGLDLLKQNLSDHSALADVRRSSHTLKGAAGAVGIESITRLAHRMEDLLDALSEQHQSVTISQLETMLLTADRIQDLSSGPLEIVETAESMASIYSRYDAEMSAFKSAIATDVVPNVSVVASKADEHDNCLTENASNGLTLGNSEVSDHIANAGAFKAKSEPLATPVDSKSSNSGQYLRVPLERIDSLVALIGEMVINRAAINQRMVDFANRIQDMQLAVNRFRAIAQDMEKSFCFEAMHPRDHRTISGGRVPKKDGHRTNRIAAFTRPELHGLMHSAAHLGLDSLEFDRYSQLHLLARSVAEATNDIAVITNEFRNVYGDIDSLVERQQRHNRDAQDGLMQIRMLPISSIVSRLERTVRTVSNKLGKHVDLVVIGENTELDKTVLEEITDPLLHLMRNALDHGIETSEERAAAGKSARASLTLETLNQGTQVTLRVSDDGRGLDVTKIRSKAIEQGLIEDHVVPTDEEIHDLIFLPGFSTAENLTDISGRGVGMDVVREAVQRLKGTIRVESSPGKGASFTIHLPMSLSVTRALIVSSGPHIFAIPMQSVEQITRMDMVTTNKFGTQTFVKRDEKLVRLRSLAQHLDLRSEATKVDTSAPQPVLFIRSGDNEVAVTVDSVRGGQDIVVKSLGDHLRTVPGYLGATLAGDGTVIPILDPSDLCGEKVAKRSAQSLKGNETNARRRRTAMVIDDSLSVRRVATNLLRSHGWDVIDAKDGVDALEKLGSHDTPPDIFLCDMEMPRMDGLELIERLRGMSEFASTPIVMVTSRSSEKHRRLAADAGANEHVVKPFKDDQLLALIDRMVTEHRELVRV